MIGILAVLIAVGFGAEWLIRRALTRAPKPTEDDGAGQAMLSEIAALSTFALASAGSFLAFEWPPLLRRIILTLLLALIVFRVVRAIARFLLVFGGAEASLTSRHGAFESDAAPFLAPAGRARCRLPAVRLGHRQPHARFGLLPRSDPARRVSVRAGHSGDGNRDRLAAARQAHFLVARSLLTLYLVVLWAAWVAGLLGLLWLGIFSLVLPTAVRGVGDVAQFWPAGQANRRRRRHARRADRQRRQGGGHSRGGRVARLYLAHPGRRAGGQRTGEIVISGRSTPSSSSWWRI